MFSRMAVLKMVRIPLRSTPLFRILANQMEKIIFYLDVTVRLLSISQPYYRYLRAMNCLNSEDYNETFMEPVIVPQNVSGGLGFVGASSEQQVTLRMVDRPPLSYPK